MRHQHSLQLLKRLNNTDQILVTSNIELIKLCKATCNARGKQIWISVIISTILSTCEESKTDKVIELIYVSKIMRRVNNFPSSVVKYENNTFRNARYLLRKISASTCMKPSYNEHISKSQGAAQLRVQLITTIYEVLNAKRRHYARVPSLTDHDVLLNR